MTTQEIMYRDYAKYINRQLYGKTNQYTTLFLKTLITLTNLENETIKKLEYIKHIAIDDINQRAFE